MSSEVAVNSKNEPFKIERKIYSRDDMMRYFYCPKEIPEYLKEFSEIINENVNELWYKKPLPTFDEVPKATIPPRLAKARQRTTSNQSIEVDKDDNPKYRNKLSQSAMKSKADSSNRYTAFNDQESSATKIGDREWKTIEPKIAKNLSKQYVLNNADPENHWKKWSKERTYSDNKSKPTLTFSRNEKTNNFVVRKADTDNKPEISKARTSCSVSAEQTEDIWQDDWDTEMRSQIAQGEPEETLESYELPPASLSPPLPPLSPLPASVIDHLIRGPPPPLPPISSKTPPIDDPTLWYFLDPTGREQGPFPGSCMANWLAVRYLDDCTFVRRQCDERTLILAEFRALYGRIPFIVGPSSVPPIRWDTAITIEPIALAAGVDPEMLHKVFSNATCLSKIDSNVDKKAFYEEKRQFEEEKAIFERERQRLLDEQEQWKRKLEQERQALLLQQSAVVMEEVAQDPIIDSVDLWKAEEEVVKVEEVVQEPEDIEVEEIAVEVAQMVVANDKVGVREPLKEENGENMCPNEWMSIKMMKNVKKNKKAKNKAAKVAAAETIKVEVTQVPKVAKETGNVHIVPRERIEELKQKSPETPKSDLASLWSMKPIVPKAEVPKATKSLLEIQAEEAAEERVRLASEKVQQQAQAEASKVTSFKESLLKSVRPLPAPPVTMATTRPPLIPAGKSIWDMATVEEVQRPILAPTKTRDHGDRDRDQDRLSLWCQSRLSKFQKDLDIVTVTELLREVPLEHVAELALELLDDSAFSRTFAREFVKMRQEAEAATAQEAWQTVKKSNAAPPASMTTAPPTASVSKGKAGGPTKSKAKKKMVVIDHTKFRSA